LGTIGFDGGSKMGIGIGIAVGYYTLFGLSVKVT
jgi:hypothetical protein